MQNTTKPLVSVIVPAFNEETTIGNVLECAETVLENLNLPYEVIVVNDGSSDDTKHIIQNNGAKLISYPKNRGKGYALRRGLASANGDILVTMDADGSHTPDDIPRLIKPLFNGVDVVIGSRFSGNNGKEVTTKTRHFGNGLINFLMMVFTRKRITDSQTGFRAFKRKTLKGIKLFSWGYGIETELTIKTLRNGFKVIEEPVTIVKRQNGTSKLKTFKDGFRIFKTILKAYFI